MRAISFADGVEGLLSRRGLRIKDFGRFVQAQSDQLIEKTKDRARRGGRPYEYLRHRIRKDDEARRIDARDDITEGLVCVFSELENCPSFKIAYGLERPRIQAARRKCLCVYYYLLHPELGLIHVHIQSWVPFVVQVAVNGHDGLAPQMRHRRMKTAYASPSHLTAERSKQGPAQIYIPLQPQGSNQVTSYPLPRMHAWLSRSADASN